MLKARTLLFISVFSIMLNIGCASMYSDYNIEKFYYAKVVFGIIALITFFWGTILLIIENLRETKQENKTHLRKAFLFLGLPILILILVLFIITMIDVFICESIFGFELL